MPKKCKVKGAIISNEWKWIYDWFGYDSTCPNDIEKALEGANGDDLELDINSGGGDVYAGSEIYTLLKSYKGKTVGRVMGVAASAASVIGMGCTELHMSPTAQIMIHNAASRASGDYRDMQHSADVLSNWNKSISNAYQLKTGLSQEALLGLMNNETWLNAKQAVEMKFADSILFDQQNQLVASSIIADEAMIPIKILEKLRNSGLLQNDKNNSQNPEEGDDSMPLSKIMAKLSAEEQAVVKAEFSNAVVEQKALLQKEKEGLQNKVTELEGTVAELQTKVEASLLAAQPSTEEDILANLDPKVLAIIENARKAGVEAQNELQRIRDENEVKEFNALASSFDKLPIDASEYGPIFRNISKADKEGFEKITALLTSVNNMANVGEVFKNSGSNSGTVGNAWDQIQAKVEALLVTNNKLTRPQAMLQVMRDEPALYNQYKEELQDEPAAE
jgi:ATP-dependent protease ClpP protease subunit